MEDRIRPIQHPYKVAIFVLNVTKAT